MKIDSSEITASKQDVFSQEPFAERCWKHHFLFQLVCYLGRVLIRNSCAILTSKLIFSCFACNAFDHRCFSAAILTCSQRQKGQHTAIGAAPKFTGADMQYHDAALADRWDVALPLSYFICFACVTFHWLGKIEIFMFAAAISIVQTWAHTEGALL